MSHTHLIELYSYIDERRSNAETLRTEAGSSDADREAARGAETFLADTAAFLSSRYHGKLPKRLRARHLPR